MRQSDLSSAEPEWVALLCAIPLLFAESRQSIFELVQAADPDIESRARFVSAVTLYLRHHPELIEAWHGYSMDKRTSGAYFQLGAPSEVGELSPPPGTRRENIRHYGDPAEACADFTWREVTPMVERAQP